MPLDRAAAKAAGYSDQEIDAYVERASSQTQTAATAPTGRPSLPPRGTSGASRLNEPMTSVFERSNEGNQRAMAGALPMLLGLATGPGYAVGAGGGKLLENQMLREVGLQPNPGIARSMMGSGAPGGVAGEGIDALESAGLGTLAGVGQQLGGKLLQNPMARKLGGMALKATVGEGRGKAIVEGVKMVGKAFGGGAAAKVEGAAAKAGAAATKRPNLPVRVAREAEKSDRIAVAAHTRAKTPAPKPKLEVVSRPSAVKAEAPKPRPSLPKKVDPDTPTMRYFSESKGEHIDIEKMHPAHLRSAIGKRQRELEALGKNAEKRAPVKWAEMEAMKKELTRRLSQSEHTAY